MVADYALMLSAVAFFQSRKPEAMKKTFPLQDPVKAPARVVEAVKHEVRKYVRREYNKPLPEGSDLRVFACKVGATAETAVECALDDVAAGIDRIASEGAAQVYVEIESKLTKRTPGAEPQPGES